ncbi:hypothetical protein BY996DRAFT_6413654 [Phakopsora pachyrhizi]|uniref:Uncharacterized protein n=1 Tax=Phakopsora pachyrhizi TaxID=170000 RepID=A0AAV0BNP7_PHAPC|nr:hypothetical protein BY996DRAFT_6413654 [Phakopsora pachyrhizi]CAH7688279.1 hypothetical protein PPACK8108_LOCUS23218 [Phakopsora pachyrhizi]
MVIERIGKSLKKDGDKLVVKMKPKAVSKTNNLDMAELMGRVARENKKVSQDKDNDDDDQGRLVRYNLDSSKAGPSNLKKQGDVVRIIPKSKGVEANAKREQSVYEAGRE